MESTPPNFLSVCFCSVLVTLSSTLSVPKDCAGSLRVPRCDNLSNVPFACHRIRSMDRDLHTWGCDLPCLVGSSLDRVTWRFRAHLSWPELHAEPLIGNDQSDLLSAARPRARIYHPAWRPMTAMMRARRTISHTDPAADIGACRTRSGQRRVMFTARFDCHVHISNSASPCCPSGFKDWFLHSKFRIDPILKATEDLQTCLDYGPPGPDLKAPVQMSTRCESFTGEESKVTPLLYLYISPS